MEDGNGPYFVHLPGNMNLHGVGPFSMYDFQVVSASVLLELPVRLKVYGLLFTNRQYFRTLMLCIGNKCVVT